VPPVPLARHLLRARDLADAHYDRTLDLAQLARAANVSERHFSRSFRRAYGETPYQYLLSRRLERARHLLRTTEMQVAEICLAVGFTSVGSFTTTFRRHVGITPLDYRHLNAGRSARDQVPLCYLMAWTRQPGNGAFREDSAEDAG
jgi:transcriptional regulator GlxA family with amidase domain